jgi:glutamate--cysteine ligase
MSTRVAGPQGPTIESRDALVAYLEAGNKPMADWRIGTEHEKFGFYRQGHTPVPYDGDRGIRALLDGMKRRFCWDGVVERGNIIALQRPDCPKGGVISLEPGGQLELSGSPLASLHETDEELRHHLSEVTEIGNELGIGFLGIGFSPKWTLAETPVMPKARYGIMQRYMPTKGRLGLDMMFRTSTVQVNLDFSSEADMVKKLRVSLALQPVATALFANSPFTEGKPNGYKSFRSAVWLDTDPDRSGMLPFAFEKGMGYERYVDYALDVPMYFVHRDGHYHNTSGESFRAFLEGKLPQLPGVRPTLQDWADHLTTIFPEVRLKKFLEMRGADTGPWRTLCALPALWVGIFYDQAALDGAWELVRDWSAEDRQKLREAVPRQALQARVKGRLVQDVAKDMLALSRRGLGERRIVGCKGKTETRFLDDLDEIAASGRTRAEDLLQLYETSWNRDVRRVFRDFAY